MKLPPAPSDDPRNETSTLLPNFTTDVARHVYESVRDEGFCGPFVLLGNYSFVLQKTFIERIIMEWHTTAIVLCKTVYTTISDHVKKLVHKHFHGFGQGHLEQRVKGKCELSTAF
jgi:hypothetical protein